MLAVRPHIEIEEGSRWALCRSAPTFWLDGHDQTRLVQPTAMPCVTPLNRMYYWFHATLRRWQGKSTWPWIPFSDVLIKKTNQMSEGTWHKVNEGLQESVFNDGEGVRVDNATYWSELQHSLLLKSEEAKNTTYVWKEKMQKRLKCTQVCPRSHRTEHFPISMFCHQSVLVCFAKSKRIRPSKYSSAEESCVLAKINWRQMPCLPQSHDCTSWPKGCQNEF